jgi:hypothetical protein
MNATTAGLSFPFSVYCLITLMHVFRCSCKVYPDRVGSARHRFDFIISLKFLPTQVHLHRSKQTKIMGELSEGCKEGGVLSLFLYERFVHPNPLLPLLLLPNLPHVDGCCNAVQLPWTV